MPFRRTPMLRLGTLLLVCSSILLLSPSGPWAQPSGATASPCEDPAEQTLGQQETWAVVDGESITRADAETPIEGQLADLYDRIYGLQKRSLEQVINMKLLEQEAKRRNLSVEKLIDMEIKPKIPPITQQEVDRQYAILQQSQKDLKADKQAVSRSIYSQRYYAVMGEYIDRLKKERNIQILLERPRLFIHDVATEDNPWTGSPNASVTIVEFTDFQCPTCKKVHENLKAILQQFQGQARLIVRDFPLSSHRLAQKAAEASQCAHDQGKYWEYANLLFAEQDSMSEGSFEAHARTLALKWDPFRECLTSGKYRHKVQRDKADGIAAGVAGTPTLFVNGRRVADLRQETIESAIRRELDHLKAQGPAHGR
jgi:protein-disulfide isomerase